VAEKEQTPLKKNPRIIREDYDFIMASAIREANHEKQHLDSHASSNAEDSSAKEQTGADLPPSPPDPVFTERQPFFLSNEDAQQIASENGVDAESVSLASMMMGAQSLSAASSASVINAAKRIQIRIEAEKDEAAKKAAEKFEEETRLQQKREDIIARLAQRRSGSVGGGASASAAVVPSSEEDGRLTLSQMTLQKGAVIKSECGGLLSLVKATASKKETPQSVEQSAEHEFVEEAQ
jgi:hypothetical protein